MREFKELVARIDKDHWILLSQSLNSDDWSFVLWGTHPLIGNLGAVSEPEAKTGAFSAALEHLGKHGLKLHLADSAELSWRVALRYVAA
jgi:hypothetical protein